MNSNYYINVEEKFGRGLYASFNLQAGKILTEEELLVLDKLDGVLVNQTDLKNYTFKFDNERDCLVLGDGELYNHSMAPNIGYRLVNGEGIQSGRKLMQFYTLRAIQAGEQLFIDYTADEKVDVNTYTKNLF